MNRAQFQLSAVLDLEHPGTSLFSELDGHAARERFAADPEQRRSNMVAVVGLWAEREEFPDTATYMRNLRDDERVGRLRRA